MLQIYTTQILTTVPLRLMNIVVDAANIPQMPAGTKYNQDVAYRFHY